jgi:putative ABC transport system ATP-binding protein
VTHDAAHAAWADRVVFLRDGRLVDEARPASNPDIKAADDAKLAMSAA